MAIRLERDGEACIPRSEKTVMRLAGPRGRRGACEIVVTIAVLLGMLGCERKEPPGERLASGYTRHVYRGNEEGMLVDGGRYFKTPDGRKSEEIVGACEFWRSGRLEKLACPSDGALFDLQRLETDDEVIHFLRHHQIWIGREPEDQRSPPWSVIGCDKAYYSSGVPATDTREARVTIKSGIVCYKLQGARCNAYFKGSDGAFYQQFLDSDYRSEVFEIRTRTITCPSEK